MDPDTLRYVSRESRRTGRRQLRYRERLGRSHLLSKKEKVKRQNAEPIDRRSPVSTSVENQEVMEEIPAAESFPQEVAQELPTPDTTPSEDQEVAEGELSASPRLPKTKKKG